MENLISLSVKLVIQCVLALFVLETANVTDYRIGTVLVAAVAIACVYRHITHQKFVGFQSLRTE